MTGALCAPSVFLDKHIQTDVTSSGQRSSGV